MQTSPANPSTLPSILLVEDHGDTSVLIRRVLRNAYRVTCATTGEQALEEAQRAPFDLVLVDINLGGGITGLDVLQALRATAEYASVPIVAVTAKALPGDRARFLQSGFTAYLSKPFRTTELHELVGTLVPS